MVRIHAFASATAASGRFDATGMLRLGPEHGYSCPANLHQRRTTRRRDQIAQQGAGPRRRYPIIDPTPVAGAGSVTACSL